MHDLHDFLQQHSAVVLSSDLIFGVLTKLYVSSKKIPSRDLIG